MVRPYFKCGKRKRGLDRDYERAFKEMWKNQGGEVSEKTKKKFSRGMKVHPEFTQGTTPGVTDSDPNLCG